MVLLNKAANFRFSQTMIAVDAKHEYVVKQYQNSKSLELYHLTKVYLLCLKMCITYIEIPTNTTLLLSTIVALEV